MLRRRWVLRGQVQGVGYRPFIYRLAHAHRVGGFVRNTIGGVDLEAQGTHRQLRAFAKDLREAAPALARITDVVVEDVEPLGEDTTFRILAHDVDDRAGATDGKALVNISVDTAVCPLCLAEMRSLPDRRRGYGLINCTNCGPRFTIVRRLPYERCNTTMSGFAMCDPCAREYREPADRRFHAQPISCHDCGPQIALVMPRGELLAGDPVPEAARLLAAGRIIGIKGVGGFHLAVRADDARAVARLRSLKHRDAKPFALMCRSSADAQKLLTLSRRALEAIESPAAPIILAPRTSHRQVAENIAPGTDRLGVMLPYAPLHHLIFDAIGARGVSALVMTSGNRCAEPLVIDNADALARLGDMCDALLWHDRPILRGLDDSVLTDAGDDLIPVRRARGFVPAPLRIPIDDGGVGIALGGELKSTVALVRDGAAILSGHLGDLTQPAAYRAFCAAVEDLSTLFDVRPRWVAHDLHPAYLSTAHAKRMASSNCAQMVAVQHHHAHAAAVIVEHGLAGPVLAIVCDGTGYGTDGTIWGGELLVADLLSFKRLARLRPLLLPGGDAAALDPRRAGVALLAQSLGGGFENQAAATRLMGRRDDRLMLAQMIRTGAGCVVSSGAGRLFDGIAALLDVCTQNSFEAEAAMALEAAANSAEVLPTSSPLVELRRGNPVELDFSPLVRELLKRQDEGVPPPMLAALFHEQFALAWDALIPDAVARTGLTTVALSGGVFCNIRLLKRITGLLRARGLTVLVHREVPPNDGGLSLGQAAIAAARSSRGLLPSS